MYQPRNAVDDNGMASSRRQGYNIRMSDNLERENIRTIEVHYTR